MTLEEVDWIRDGMFKLGSSLRRELLDLYRTPRPAWCFTHGPLIAYRERFRHLPVIIQLRDDQDGPSINREGMCQGLRQQGCRSVRQLGLVDCIAANVPVRVLKELIADRRIKRISLDRKVTTQLDVAAPTVGAPSLWDLPLNGQGVGIAVLDTGIAPHRDFTQPDARITAFRDFVNNRRDPYDDNGHGTHCAGIAAGSGAVSDGRYRGIAPGANLIGIKVLDALGSGSMSTVIEGLAWAVAERERLGIEIVSVSLGAPAQDGFEDDPVAQAAGRAAAHGLVVVVAAGNSGPRARTIATPGIHPAVVTVGASDGRGTVTRDDDTVADFSSRGPTVDDLTKPDLVAPGVEITAANADGSTTAKQLKAKGEDYITQSGTSMATPVCAGIAALLLEHEPGLSPAQVKQRLIASCTDMGLNPNIQGAGLVDARDAL